MRKVSSNPNYLWMDSNNDVYLNSVSARYIGYSFQIWLIWRWASKSLPLWKTASLNLSACHEPWIWGPPLRATPIEDFLHMVPINPHPTTACSRGTLLLTPLRIPVRHTRRPEAPSCFLEVDEQSQKKASAVSPSAGSAHGPRGNRAMHCAFHSPTYLTHGAELHAVPRAYCAYVSHNSLGALFSKVRALCLPPLPRLSLRADRGPRWERFTGNTERAPKALACHHKLHRWPVSTEGILSVVYV